MFPSYCPILPYTTITVTISRWFCNWKNPPFCLAIIGVMKIRLFSAIRHTCGLIGSVWSNQSTSGSEVVQGRLWKKPGKTLRNGPSLEGENSCSTNPPPKNLSKHYLLEIVRQIGICWEIICWKIMKWRYSLKNFTYCWWRNPALVEVGSLSHHLQGVIHPRWCRISSTVGMKLGYLEPCLNPVMTDT